MKLGKVLFCVVIVLLTWLTSSANSEIRKGADGTIVMSESDYRAIISTAMEERAQKETLQRILKEERASFDVIIAEAKTLDEARKEERERSAAALAEKDKRISQLEGTIKKLRRSVWFPGVIGGVTADNGGKLEGAIGFGWKLSIF